MAKNILGAKIPTNASLKANIATTPAKSSQVVPKPTGTARVLNPTPKPTKGGSRDQSKPPFLSKEGQQEALSRVANVLNPFSNDPISVVNPLSGNVLINDAGAVTRSVVRLAEAGSVAYGVSLIPSAVGGFATKSAGATSLLPASFDTFKPFVLPTVAGLGGFLAGGFLGNKTAPMSQTTTADQTTISNQYTYSPQITDARQYSDVKQIFTIKDSPGASLYGTAIPSQTVAPTQSIAPIQDVAPSQDVAPNQAQGTGLNWLTVALLGVGAYFILRK